MGWCAEHQRIHFYSSSETRNSQSQGEVQIELPYDDWFHENMNAHERSGWIDWAIPPETEFRVRTIIRSESCGNEKHSRLVLCCKGSKLSFCSAAWKLFRVPRRSRKLRGGGISVLGPALKKNMTLQWYPVTQRSLRWWMISIGSFVNLDNWMWSRWKWEGRVLN